MMLDRCSFVITGAGGATWAAEPPIRYPDPHIKVLDPRFQHYVLGNAALERRAGGGRFTEGPVWFGDGRYLIRALSLAENDLRKSLAHAPVVVDPGESEVLERGLAHEL